MSVDKFSIGDHIVMTRTHCQAKEGMTGTIITLPTFMEPRYGVRFDEPMGGHSLGGRCPSGYGHWIPGSDMELLTPDYDPSELDALLLG